VKSFGQVYVGGRRFSFLLAFLVKVFSSVSKSFSFLVSRLFLSAAIMENNSDVKEFPQVTPAVTKDVGDVENAGARNTHTKRGLSSRQIQFLALGMSDAIDYSSLY